MASYLDQIPKQLAARRKAFAAARKNPALLPSCWAIVRSIAGNLHDYMRNSVISGCTFPDRPFTLSVEDAAFLNFGTTPKLLERDSAWIEAESGGAPPPDAEDAQPRDPGRQARIRRQLAGVAGTYGQNQGATRVYSLEPWLQDMYRDRLDVDFAEDLQRQIDALNLYMDGVPKALSASGLSGKLAKGVMDAFNLFKTITGSSHQLDREKMSFIDRRSYVDTVQKIEQIMVKADQSLGAAAAGRSVVRELFGMWKDANYEMMALSRQLRALWAGTSLDDRIAELTKLLGSVQCAVDRCTEESSRPRPQLPVLRADSEQEAFITRSAVAEAFRDLLLYDMVLGDNTVLANREIRKFGPLSVIITPGEGQARYCAEIRRIGASTEPGGRNVDSRIQTRGRELDVDQRIRYPLNCLVVPVGSPPETLLEDLADAWLEYNQFAFPIQLKELLEAAKGVAAASFAPPADWEAKDIPATHARQCLARLVAGFARWAQDGREPDPEKQPGFQSFLDLVRARLGPLRFFIPPQYRPLVDLFSEAGDKRRTEMWKRGLGPRYSLDRQLVAVCVLRKDWKVLRESLKCLPRSVTRENSSLENGFARVRDTRDPFAEHKGIAFFRKFLTDNPDLKSALVSVESRVAIEVETLRAQSESLGQVFQYDQASESMLQRQASQIREQRNTANGHIDQYLTGLMYAMDGNYEAAESALVMCLTPENRRQTDIETPPPPQAEIEKDWFENHLRPREGKFEKRRVPGVDSPGTLCHDFIYINLALVYMKQGRHTEALISLRGAREKAEPGKSHLYLQWIDALVEEINAKQPQPRTSP